MFTWKKTHISNKLIAILIVGVFVVVTFACFTMTSNEAHSSDMGIACETIMNLADNTIVQTGLVLFFALVAAWLGFGSRVFTNRFELNLHLSKIYSPPLYKQTSSREYSYLSQLFSSGLIHSKLHSFSM